MLLRFHKVTALPPSLDANAIYFVLNGDYAEAYLTDAAGVAKAVGNSAMIAALAGGATFHEHVQSAAATLWTINHNLGREPTVSVKTTGGAEVEADVVHISANQVRIQFSQPLAGRAYCV